MRHKVLPLVAAYTNTSHKPTRTVTARIKNELLEIDRLKLHATKSHVRSFLTGLHADLYDDKCWILFVVAACDFW